jgi:hypothetical protein
MTKPPKTWKQLNKVLWEQLEWFKQYSKRMEQKTSSHEKTNDQN